MPYKITASTGKQMFPPDLKTLLEEIDRFWNSRSRVCSESLPAREQVVSHTKQILDRWVANRLIQNGDAICDESVNHVKIWAAGECYMMVCINLTLVSSVVVRYYVNSPDHDSYFTMPQPKSPFVQLFERYQAAKALADRSKVEADALFEQVKAECPHERVMTKVHKVAGSYLDRGYTDTWTECVVCGKRSDIRREQGNFG